MKAATDNLNGRIAGLLAALAMSPAAVASGSETIGLTVSGLIEVESAYRDPRDPMAVAKNGEIILATAALGIAVRPVAPVLAGLTFLYEQNATDPEIDEARVTVSGSTRPWSSTVGQQYLPFGRYATKLLSDPLTLTIGEARKTAIIAAIEPGDVSFGVFLFSDDLTAQDSRRYDNMGAFAGFHAAGGPIDYDFYISYINDLGDSDGIWETVQENTSAAAVSYEKSVAGIALDGSATWGAFVVTAEYLSATARFNSDELAFRATGAKPSALNLELGYQFVLLGLDSSVAFAFQSSEQAAALGLPERRLGTAISLALRTGTSLSFEWLYDDDYRVVDGGTGQSGMDTLTAQLAVEF